MQILPGILESSFEAIEERVAEVAHVATRVHVDVCDGTFVQNKTWPYSGITTGRIEENMYVNQLRSEEIGLPSWDKMEYQFDLMIKDPWRTMEIWAGIGAASVVLHPTSCETKEKVLESITLAESLFMDVYISYTYDEWMRAKEHNGEALHMTVVKGIQCMTIRHIGLQGQPFDDRWLSELSWIRETYPHLTIQLDGGINEDAPENLAELGVTSVVVGSGIFAEGNATENFRHFSDYF